MKVNGMPVVSMLSFTKLRAGSIWNTMAVAHGACASRKTASSVILLHSSKCRMSSVILIGTFKGSSSIHRCSYESSITALAVTRLPSLKC